MKFENKYTKIYCPLCDREIPLDVPKSLHHLIPKSKGGKGGPTVLLHHICHKQIHLLFKENELAKNLNNIEDLKSHPKLEKFINWVKNRRIDYPNLHVYHYASYEKTALGRLATNHGIHKTTWDQWLREELFIDLFPIV